MAASACTRDLEHVPMEFDIKLLKEHGVQANALEHGFQFFVEQYVHDIKFDIGRPEEVTISGRCFKSMKKSQPPHQLHVSLSRCGPTQLKDLHCSCQAG